VWYFWIIRSIGSKDFNRCGRDSYWRRCWRNFYVKYVTNCTSSVKFPATVSVKNYTYFHVQCEENNVRLTFKILYFYELKTASPKDYGFTTTHLQHSGLWMKGTKTHFQTETISYGCRHAGVEASTQSFVEGSRKGVKPKLHLQISSTSSRHRQSWKQVFDAYTGAYRRLESKPPPNCTAISTLLDGR